MCMISYMQLLSYITLPLGEMHHHRCRSVIPGLQKEDGSLRGKLFWVKASTVGLCDMEVPLALPSMFWCSSYPRCSATAALEVRLR